MRSHAHTTTLALVLAAAATAAAQPDLIGPTLPGSPAATAAATDTSQLSPRSAMRGYLAAAREERWGAAARYLNLANLPARNRAQQGEELARKLKAVLDRTVVVDLEALSPAPEGNPNDGQPDGRDLLGTIETPQGPTRIYLERTRGDDQTLEWRFSRPTVDKIERLYDEFGHEPPFADRLPAVFFSWRWLDLALWQWLGMLAIALASLLAAFTVVAVVVPIARAITRRTPVALDDAIVEMIIGPLRLALAVGFAKAGLPWLWLPLGPERVCAGSTTGLGVVAVTWIAVRLVTVLSRVIQLRMATQGSAVGLSAIPLVRRMVNAVVVLLAVVLVLANLGVNMTGVLAGLGVGGLAVALAAQKSLENLFGGVTLIMDQPVHVGDVCRFDQRVGTVEDIGLRSTRIRTVERTLVTIPNAEFSTMQIENFGRRDRIVLSTRLGVRYETTPDQLRHLLVELKKMLLAHPKVDPDPARVRFANFGEYSLDIDLFAYVRTTDYNEFLAVREDLFLRIMDLIAASGTGFAFPSQTHYEAGDGLDPERARAAEAAVRAWRDAGTLFLPDIPGDEAAKLVDTLDYPPRGSAQRP